MNVSLLRRVALSRSRLWRQGLRLASLGLIFGITLAGAKPAHAANIAVTTLIDEDNGTSSPNSGTGTSLREAINAANAASGSDTIFFAPALKGTLSLLSPLPAISTNITVDGQDARNVTIKADPNSDAVFVINAGVTATLSGLTIEGSGSEGSQTDKSCLLNAGALTLTDCTIRGGNADSGGGINNARTGNLSIARCAVINCRSDYGGGIFNNGTLSLVNSTLYSNVAIYGGGLYNTFAATIRFCTFSKNVGQFTPGSGGGSGNGGWDVVGSGGGGGGSDQTPIGSAIYGLGGNLSLAATILESSDSYNFHTSNSTLSTGGGNVSSDNSGPNSASDVRHVGIGFDPDGLKLNGGTTPTVALLSGSIAVNHGGVANVPVTDQRGIARPQGASADTGAFETAQVVSGTLTFQGIASTAPAQPTDFTLRPVSGNPLLYRANVAANGTFLLLGIPAGSYTLHIKGGRYLAKNLTVNLTSGNVGGATVLLKAGDANDDDAVDIADLLLVISHYNQVQGSAGYLEAGDFNLDGKKRHCRPQLPHRELQPTGRHLTQNDAGEKKHSFLRQILRLHCSKFPYSPYAVHSQGKTL